MARKFIALNYITALSLFFLPSQNLFAQTNDASPTIVNQKQTLSENNKNKKAEKTFQIVDITNVSADDPLTAVKTITLAKNVKTIKCDVFIAGGGLGGVAAAQKIWQLNEKVKNTGKLPLRVILSEETDWLGGQATAQGVSALDENYLVESTGCTANYQKLRHAIRNNYKSNHKLTETAAQQKYLNPGTCWVSRLAFEPKVALEEIDTLLTPAFADSSLKVFYRHKLFYAKNRRKIFSFLKNNPVKSVYLANLDTGEQLAVRAKIFIDATECGDLLPLAKLPYTSGVESKDTTGELHAPPYANSDNVQDYTYPFAIELRTGENHTITKPSLYDELLQQGQFSFGKFKMFADSERDTPEGKQKLLPFWTYRRLIDTNNFTGGDYPHDISMINWSSNDVRGKNFIDRPAAEKAKYLAFGKLVSLGFLYWLQTTAPRDDGGIGYPELALCPDIMGTHDGLSKHPYIRESRRALTKYTVVEQDIAASSNQTTRRAKLFNDSTGIGLYPIDIHGHEEIPGAGQASKPFQIPLGSLIPRKYTAVLPACKNIGVTHITNGAYRLHPVEWAIGEAQGALTHYCLIHKATPEQVFNNLLLLRDFQRLLIETGVPIYWFNDISPEHPAFSAAQYLAVANIMPGDKDHLNFHPDKPITHAEVAYALAKLFSLDTDQAVKSCLDCGLFAAQNDQTVDPGKPLNNAELKSIAEHKLFKHIEAAQTLLNLDAANDSSLTRAQFAIWLFTVAQSRPLFGKL